MNPKQFLLYGGVILLVLGLGGFILQPISGGQLIGDQLFFDGAENIAHTILGIVAIGAAYVLSASLQKWLVAIVGVIAVLTAVLGFAVVGQSSYNPAQYNFGPANLELLDDLLHLVVGVWALWAAFRSAPAMAASRSAVPA